jgi:hypothetical protein
MRRQLATVVLGTAIAAFAFAACTLLPGDQLFLPDVVIGSSFGAGLVLTVALTVWHIRFTAANRLPQDPAASAVYDRLYRRWTAAWPSPVLRAFRTGYVLGIGMTALSVYQLRNGGAAIEHGQYYLSNRGSVHPISRPTWLGLREDEKRLFATGAAVVLTIAAGLLRIDRMGRRSAATLPMLVEDV